MNSFALNKKYKYYLSYLMIIISAIYVYSEYKNSIEALQNNTEENMLTYFNIYKKTYDSSSKQKDIQIKNNSNEYTDNLKDEFLRTTPIMITRDNIKKNDNSLSFEFFDINNIKEKHIKNKILKLQDKEYIQITNTNSIYLFGKVLNDGYVLINKDLEQTKQVKLVIDELFYKILFISLLDIILLIYFIHLINLQEKNKERLHKEFEQLQIDAKNIAFKDTLTGAATRLKFDETLKDLINIASRFKEQKFTAIMIDIDNFKNVNDTYGHDYGDIVLQKIAEIVKQNIRKTDTFARWGGEEFVILSPMNNLKDSLDFANKIRQLIASTNFDKLGYVTSSFGLVEYQEGDTEKTLMKRVDDLLYKAKQNGKNRVEYIN